MRVLRTELETCPDDHSGAAYSSQGTGLGKGEGTLDAAFGFGLTEGGWAFLWVSRGGGLLRQESAILPNLCSI